MHGPIDHCERAFYCQILEKSDKASTVRMAKRIDEMEVGKCWQFFLFVKRVYRG